MQEILRINSNPFSKKSDSLYTQVNAEYQILLIEVPSIFYGNIDLSEMTTGDSVSISVWYAVGNGEFKLNTDTVIKGPVTDPILDITAHYGSRTCVKIKQLTGEARQFKYDFVWQHV